MKTAPRRGLTLLQWSGVWVFLLTLLLGWWLPEQSELWVRSLFWGLFWPVVTVSVLVIAGPLFCGVCPLGVMGRAISRHGLRRRLPRWLTWTGWSAIMLLTCYWLVNTVTVGYSRLPLQFTLLFFSGFVVLMLGLSLWYRDAPFCRSLCPFAILAKSFGQQGFVRLRSVQATCDSCEQGDCAHHCPLKLSPKRLGESRTDGQCQLCLECYRHCRGLSLQLGHRQGEQQGTPAAITLLILTALVAITSQLTHRWDRGPWRELMPWHRLDEGLSTLVSISGFDSRGLSIALVALLLTLGLAACCALVVAGYARIPWAKALSLLAQVNVPLVLGLLLSHGWMMFAMRGVSDLSQGLGLLFGQAWTLPGLERQSSWMAVFGVLTWLGVAWSLWLAWRLVAPLAKNAWQRLGLWCLAANSVWLFVALRVGGQLLAAQGVN
ncbi:MAG: 4Fe-4S binding protein, partial [Shewanella sp.]